MESFTHVTIAIGINEAKLRRGYVHLQDKANEILYQPFHQGHRPYNQGYQPYNQGYQPFKQGYQANNYQGYQANNYESYQPTQSVCQRNDLQLD